jgi:LysM repeat protein
MNATAMTYGNLALKGETVDVRNSFEVIDGRLPRAGVRIASHARVAVQQKPAQKEKPYSLILLGGIVALVVISIFVSAAAHDLAFGDALASAEREEITVVSGDSLWDIAEEHPVDGLDTVETVDLIRRWNDLDSSMLTPGSTLLVPIN